MTWTFATRRQRDTNGDRKRCIGDGASNSLLNHHDREIARLVANYWGYRAAMITTIKTVLCNEVMQGVA